MKHIVMFSGGVGSWMTARRVAAKHGTNNLILLFADTKMEDEDLYRFLDEAAANVGGELIKLAEGRTPWELFFDRKFLSNSRVDHCSHYLKRKLLRDYINVNFDPKNSVIYLGIDWNEIHRFERAKKHWPPWTIAAPMCDKPYLEKDQMLDALRKEGIKVPRLYEMGFPHNNCGGFCVKAGHAHFKHLLKKMPERFAYHEQKEQEFIEMKGKKYTILKDRRGGKTKPLSLRELRECVEKENSKGLDLLDWGGCGCFGDEDGTEAPSEA